MSAPPSCLLTTCADSLAACLFVYSPSRSKLKPFLFFSASPPAQQTQDFECLNTHMFRCTKSKKYGWSAIVGELIEMDVLFNMTLTKVILNKVTIQWHVHQCCSILIKASQDCRWRPAARLSSFYRCTTAALFKIIIFIRISFLLLHNDKEHL